VVSRRVTGQTVFALLIVTVGLILLGRTTGYYDAGWLFRFVPSLFVLAGVYALVVSGFRNVVGSVLVIVVAGAWQLVTLDLIEGADVLVLDEIHTYTGQQGADVVDLWPLLIVLFGLSVLVGQYRARSHARETSDDHPTAMALFGGSEGRSTSKQLHGADLTAIFGGVEFDLRDAEIADPPAQVSATAIFGGVEVHAPPEWTVRIDVLPLFGGASDDRPRSEDQHEDVDLVVTGMALFGGISVS
jgi:hypothetical protein